MADSNEEVYISKKIRREMAESDVISADDIDIEERFYHL